MRKILFGIIVLCTFCLVPVMGADLNSSVNISQAKEVVQKIIASDKVSITYDGFKETPIGNYHTFLTSDGSSYYVNAISKTVDRVSNRFSWNETKDVRINQTQAENAALNWTSRFSPNRSGLNNVTSRLFDHGAFKEYLIEFRQIDKGVLLPNFALVSINPSNGDLLAFGSINQNVTISLSPQIKEDDALETAINQYPGIVITSHEESLYVTNLPNGEQKLVWMFTLIGKPVDMKMNGGILMIDAMDGKVLYNSQFK